MTGVSKDEIRYYGLMPGMVPGLTTVAEGLLIREPGVTGSAARESAGIGQEKAAASGCFFTAPR